MLRPFDSRLFPFSALTTPFCIILFLAFLAGCHNSSSDQTATPETLLIAPEDFITLHSNPFAFGPSISGSIQPEKKADLRAEISSVVLQVLKENGETVSQGDLLIRLDATAIRDNLNSTIESERAAGLSLTQAQRQYERFKKLQASGMVSTQSLEDAETKRNNEQSNVANAKTRTAQARQQLQQTEIRAPFNGIVSERKVSTGDTAQIGKELIKVIDPTSMRFEGLVSADTVSQIELGQSVNFRINGYPEKIFTGTVRRVNPQANPITRQVEVTVEFSPGTQPEVSGLYAEGQINTNSVAALMVPESAMMRNGDQVIVWRVKDNVIHKTNIKLGPRNLRTGEYTVSAGLKDRDILLSHPNTTLVDSQKVKVGK